MGSYNIQVTTSADTDTIFPIMVAKYNLVHGTNFTTMQYARKICEEAIERKTGHLMRLAGL